MFNILVTDDEQIVIDSLSFIINKNFSDAARVFTALSGTEAIEIVMKENIDLIFMDINMPGLSGLETVSCITKLKPNIIFGGIFGFTLQQGIRRGLMSNEAGQGTITMASAATKATHPCEQGLAQSIGVFFDTIIICTPTAFVVILSQA